MKIAVLGFGNVGSALARLWIDASHSVSTVEGNNKKGRDLPGLSVGNAAAITTNADVVALSTPWQVAESVLGPCGDLSGKILIDCTNPLTANLDGLAIGGTTSAAEVLQTKYPHAKVVKAFNTIGATLLGKTSFEGKTSDGFYCGDDAAAKATAAKLIEPALRPVDVGPLRNARYLEALAMLWIDIAVNQQQGPTFAFQIAQAK